MYINDINSLIKKSREIRKKIIDVNISDEVKIKLLIEDVYLFNIYYYNEMSFFICNDCFSLYKR